MNKLEIYCLPFWAYEPLGRYSARGGYYSPRATARRLVQSAKGYRKYQGGSSAACLRQARRLRAML